MTVAPDQFSALLQECIENDLLLTEDEQTFVRGLEFQNTSGIAYTQEQAEKLQDIHRQLTNRQFSG